MNSTNNGASSNKNLNDKPLANSFIGYKFYAAIAMALVAIIVAVLSSSNTLRTYVAHFSENSSKRVILAKLFTTYNSNQFVVFKIRTEVGIDIEIYEKDPSTFYEKLKQKFSFADDKDAFLMVDGNSVSLALSDVDKNGVMDIVAPTVDQYGLSRLNIFKYDHDLNQFTQSVAE